MATDTPNSGAWLNHCGLITGHAYSILSIFTMTDANGEKHRMVTVRNPNSFTQYKGQWNATDKAWTEDLVK